MYALHAQQPTEARFGCSSDTKVVPGAAGTPFLVPPPDPGPPVDIWSGSSFLGMLQMLALLLVAAPIGRTVGMLKALPSGLAAIMCRCDETVFFLLHE